ncbi:ABC-2 type transport system ATP-binding protein [Melghirimyces profundicolus]|uniref:ABC-2 type transport system ATP-binding protein n=1 Tax=Melghirimyces profundicolus TaxID=1242148 RepID=A0A2T6BS22_9BACL|nr:ABC transporter ATP-binding protein [Melghirimyces profundicolus]PTX58893.1 ABC-2 type transport system ATP-binding protein [Melghirimyces profundicolus]
MIRVRNLVKSYGGTRVVDGVGFEVAEGEVFGLLGPNGAGKTTTMEMMEGLRKPDRGEVCLFGVDGIRKPAKLKEIIGIQLQSTALFDHLSTEESILLYGSFYKKMRPPAELLRSFDLEEKRRTLVKHLSGGQRQRLAIALAVVHDPRVIFLDEPTTGLDPKARRALWEIILHLKEEGRTLFLSTHYMEEAEQLCDRVAIMDSGRVIALDTPARLIRQLASDSVIEFAAERGVSDAHFRELEGVKEVKRTDGGWMLLLTDNLRGTLSGLIPLADREGLVLNGLRTRSATLEDVFLERTGKRLTEQ